MMLALQIGTQRAAVFLYFAPVCPAPLRQRGCTFLKPVQLLLRHSGRERHEATRLTEEDGRATAPDGAARFFLGLVSGLVSVARLS